MIGTLSENCHSSAAGSGSSPFANVVKRPNHAKRASYKPGKRGQVAICCLLVWSS
jgi:hypothetical protein